MIRSLVFVPVSLFLGLSAAASDCAPDHVELRGDWGQARFSVEIADDNSERAQGLMFRESLATSAGMLFLYEQPHRASFWMKNTRIPLDMIFLTPEGRVASVHAEAVPGDLTPIDGGDGIIAVLEINGGLAERLGIVEGSEIRHPGFDQTKAIWPCEGS